MKIMEIEPVYYTAGGKPCNERRYEEFISSDIGAFHSHEKYTYHKDGTATVKRTTTFDIWSVPNLDLLCRDKETRVLVNYMENILGEIPGLHLTVCEECETMTNDQMGISAW